MHGLVHCWTGTLLLAYGTGQVLNNWAQVNTHWKPKSLQNNTIINIYILCQLLTDIWAITISLPATSNLVKQSWSILAERTFATVGEFVETQGIATYWFKFMNK